MKKFCNFTPRDRKPWPDRGTDEYNQRLYQELVNQCDMANRRKQNPNPICSVCNDNKVYWRVIPDEDLVYKTVAVICGCSRYQMPEFSNLSDYQTIEDWQVAVKENAADYISSAAPGAWFFIGGQIGSGKSFISSVIGRAYADRGLSVKKLIWAEVSRTLKASVFDEAYDAICNPYKTAPLLIIDDFLLGSKPSEGDIRVAREILDYRYDNKLRTVINSEKTLKEIRAIDEGAASRIADRASEHLCNIGRNPNRDWRRRKHE